MKKIILKENQFNKIFLNEYLDRNYGIPLYQYFKMDEKQRISSLIYWAIDEELLEDFWANEYDFIYDYANNIVDKQYGDDFENDEEKENYINDIVEELYSNMMYSPQDFINDVIKSYELYNEVYNYFYGLATQPQYTYSAPGWVFFSQPRLIKNEWLVHFSDNAFQIAEQGFAYGTQDLNRLAYSGAGDIHNKFGEGYDFAYLADSAMDVMYGNGNNYSTPKYGSEFVLFRASGVEVWHDGDEERQVIFYGPSAKSIIYIRKEQSKSPQYYGDDEVWQVCDIHNRRVIFEDVELEAVINWAIKNYEQYKKRIVSLDNGKFTI